MKIKKHFQISSSIELNKMKIKNKGQISFEFVMIFTLIFLVLTSFTYIINQRLTEISIEQERLVMKHLSTNIINEIVLASSVNNNYMRKFDVPGLLLGKRYDMGILDNDLLVIKMYEGERVSREHFSVIPIKVKGTFLDNINVTNTKHCITKNNYDGIRISKNQASLDSNKDKVSYGDTFFVYISFNCVEDARSVEVTLKYDFDKLILKNAEPIVRKNSNENPLFEDYRLIYDYSNSAEKYINDGGRFTYGYLSKTCATGSGNIAKIEFEVKNNIPEGDTFIEFDELYEDQYSDSNIRLLNCNTDKFTKDFLPDSRNKAKITIHSS